MKRIIVFMAACLALWHSGNALAENFADCILDKMPGTANAPAAFAVSRSCSADYPSQYYAIEKGSGLGWFGFNTPEECIIKKSRDTVQQNAAMGIAVACRCLYEKPSFPGEECEHPQVSHQAPVVITPPEPPPAPVATTPPPPVITLPRFIPPSPAELKAQAARERAYAVKVQEELTAISEKAVRDYPYLDTPAGEHAMSKIIRKRDDLIRRGMYPPSALAQAVSDYGASNVPMPVKEKKPEPIPVYQPLDNGHHNGFPPECRWVTPQEWSCK